MDKSRKSRKKDKTKKSQKNSQFFQIIETEEFYNKGFLIRKKTKTVIPTINPFNQDLKKK